MPPTRASPTSITHRNYEVRSISRRVATLVSTRPNWPRWSPWLASTPSSRPCRPLRPRATEAFFHSLVPRIVRLSRYNRTTILFSDAPFMNTSRSEFVAVRGIRLHVRRWGNADAPMLFMLHGWMDVAASFQFVVDALGGDWQVIAADMRGFGLSDWPVAERGGGNYWIQD